MKFNWKRSDRTDAVEFNDDILEDPYICIQRIDTYILFITATSFGVICGGGVFGIFWLFGWLLIHAFKLVGVS